MRQSRPVKHPELTIATQDHIVSTAPGRGETTNPQGLELLHAAEIDAFHAAGLSDRTWLHAPLKKAQP